MSTEQTGLGYMCGYTGVLKILELGLSVTIITFLILCGNQPKTYFLDSVAGLSLICTGFLMVYNVYGASKKSKLPWHWIECAYGLTCGVVFAIGAALVISLFTTGYITTGVVAFVQASVYLVDTFEQYRIAITPVPKYAWTTPNMPEFD